MHGYTHSNLARKLRVTRVPKWQARAQRHVCALLGEPEMRAQEATLPTAEYDDGGILPFFWVLDRQLALFFVGIFLQADRYCRWKE